MASRHGMHTSTSFLPVIRGPSLRTMKWQRRPEVRPFLVLPLLDPDQRSQSAEPRIERPLTATLERPELLDLGLLHKLDMSLVRKEYLAITNLTRVRTVPRNKVVKITKRVKDSEDSLSDNSARSNRKITKIHQLSNVKSSVKSKQKNDANNNTDTPTPMYRARPITTSALPEPCTTCGRPDAPERFHSHPATPASRQRPAPRVAQPQQNKTGVQKPVAIRYKARDKEVKKKEVKEEVKEVKKEEKKMRGPHTVVCYICGREFGTKSLPLHEPKCLQKWERENSQLPRHMQRKLPTKPDKALTAEQWNQRAWEASQASLAACENCGRTFLPDRLVVHQRSCKPSQHHRPPPNVAASTNRACPSTSRATATSSLAAGDSAAARNMLSTPPGTVECYICGRRFGSRSIAIHEPQCLRKWRAENDKLPSAQRRPEPVKGGHSNEPANTGSVTSVAVAAPSAATRSPSGPRKPTLPCYICGREFGSASVYIHEPQCLRKWRLENDKLPPSQRRPEPQRPDVKFTQFGADEYNESNENDNLQEDDDLTSLLDTDNSTQLIPTVNDNSGTRIAAGEERCCCSSQFNKYDNSVKFEKVQLVPDEDGNGYTIKVKLDWDQEDQCACPSQPVTTMLQDQCCCCNCQNTIPCSGLVNQAAFPVHINWADKCRRRCKELYEVSNRRVFPKNWVGKCHLKCKNDKQKAVSDKDWLEDCKNNCKEFNSAEPNDENVKFCEKECQKSISRKSTDMSQQNIQGQGIKSTEDWLEICRRTCKQYFDQNRETQDTRDKSEEINQGPPEDWLEVCRRTCQEYYNKKEQMLLQTQEELIQKCRENCELYLNSTKQLIQEQRSKEDTDKQWVERCLNLCKKIKQNVNEPVIPHNQTSDEEWIQKCRLRCQEYINQKQKFKERSNQTESPDSFFEKCRQYCEDHIGQPNKPTNRENIMEQCRKKCRDIFENEQPSVSAEDESVLLFKNPEWMNKCMKLCTETITQTTDQGVLAQSPSENDCDAQYLKRKNRPILPDNIGDDEIVVVIRDKQKQKTKEDECCCEQQYCDNYCCCDEFDAFLNQPEIDEILWCEPSCYKKTNKQKTNKPQTNNESSTDDWVNNCLKLCEQFKIYKQQNIKNTKSLPNKPTTSRATHQANNQNLTDDWVNECISLCEQFIERNRQKIEKTVPPEMNYNVQVVPIVPQMSAINKQLILEQQLRNLKMAEAIPDGSTNNQKTQEVPSAAKINLVIEQYLHEKINEALDSTNNHSPQAVPSTTQIYSIIEQYLQEKMQNQKLNGVSCNGTNFRRPQAVPTPNKAGTINELHSTKISQNQKINEAVLPNSTNIHSPLVVPTVTKMKQSCLKKHSAYQKMDDNSTNNHNIQVVPTTDTSTANKRLNLEQQSEHQKNGGTVLPNSTNNHNTHMVPTARQMESKNENWTEPNKNLEQIFKISDKNSKDNFQKMKIPNFRDYVQKQGLSKINKTDSINSFQSWQKDSIDSDTNLRRRTRPESLVSYHNLVLTLQNYSVNYQPESEEEQEDPAWQQDLEELNKNTNINELQKECGVISDNKRISPHHSLSSKMDSGCFSENSTAKISDSQYKKLVGNTSNMIVKQSILIQQSNVYKAEDNQTKSSNPSRTETSVTIDKDSNRDETSRHISFANETAHHSVKKAVPSINKNILNRVSFSADQPNTKRILKQKPNEQVAKTSTSSVKPSEQVSHGQTAAKSKSLTKTSSKQLNKQVAPNPSTKPEQVVKPTDPSAKPSEQVVKSKTPSAKPSEQVVKSRTASEKPEQVVKPTDPSAKPSEQVVKSKTPSAKPSEQVVKSRTASEKPEQVVKPTAPSAKPSEQVVKSKTPSAKPSEQVVKSRTASEKPQQVVKSATPSAKPSEQAAHRQSVTERKSDEQVMKPTTPTKPSENVKSATPSAKPSEQVAQRQSLTKPPIKTSDEQADEQVLRRQSSRSSRSKSSEQSFIKQFAIHKPVDQVSTKSSISRQSSIIKNSDGRNKKTSVEQASIKRKSSVQPEAKQTEKDRDQNESSPDPTTISSNLTEKTLMIEDYVHEETIVYPRNTVKKKSKSSDSTSSPETSSEHKAASVSDSSSESKSPKDKGRNHSNDQKTSSSENDKSDNSSSSAQNVAEQVENEDDIKSKLTALDTIIEQEITEKGNDEQPGTSDDEEVSNEQASPEDNTNEQVSPEDDQTSPEDNTNEQATPEDNTNEQVSPEDDQASPEDNTNEQVTPEDDTNEQVSPEDDQASPEDNTNDQVSPIDNTDEQVSPEDDEATPEDNTNDQVSPEENTNEQVSPEDDEASPEDNTNEEATPEDDTNEQVSPEDDEASPEDNIDEQVSPEDNTTEQESPEDNTNEQVSPSKSEQIEGNKVNDGHEDSILKSVEQASPEDDTNDQVSPIDNTDDQTSPEDNTNEQASPEDNTNEQASFSKTDQAGITDISDQKEDSIHKSIEQATSMDIEQVSHSKSEQVDIKDMDDQDQDDSFKSAEQDFKNEQVSSSKTVQVSPIDIYEQVSLKSEQVKSIDKSVGSNEINEQISLPKTEQALYTGMYRQVSHSKKVQTECEYILKSDTLSTLAELTELDQAFLAYDNDQATSRDISGQFDSFDQAVGTYTGDEQVFNDQIFDDQVYEQNKQSASTDTNDKYTSDEGVTTDFGIEAGVMAKETTDRGIGTEKKIEEPVVMSDKIVTIRPERHVEFDNKPIKVRLRWEEGECECGCCSGNRHHTPDHCGCTNMLDVFKDTFF